MKAFESSTYIATEITTELIQLQERLEERSRQLEAKAERLTSKSLMESNDTPKRGRKPKRQINPLAGVLNYYRQPCRAGFSRGYPLWLDDVLQGVARLDWYRTGARSIPLSVKTLLRILDALPVISTSNIAAMLLIEERQARRYLKATELAMPLLLKGIPDEVKSYLQGAANDDEGWSTEINDHTLVKKHLEVA